MHAISRHLLKLSHSRTLCAAVCAVLAFALTTPLAAQDDSSKVYGCGLPDVSFDVKTDKKPHPVAQPEQGKALVYFFQDDSLYAIGIRPTSRYSIDGAWVGATHSDTYFYLSVAPGEHHLCTDWEDHPDDRHAAALHFTAKPGRTYYFRVENIGIQNRESARFEPIDSDEGQLLMRRFALSISHPHK